LFRLEQCDGMLLALTHDVLWQIFHCLGDQVLHDLACACRDLLTQSSCARLRLGLGLLSTEHRALTAIPARLCPGAGSIGRRPKTLKSVRHALNQLTHMTERAKSSAASRGEIYCGASWILTYVVPWILRGDFTTRTVAVKAASTIATSGDRQVIAAILDGLPAGCDAEVSGEALRTLAGPGDVEVLARVQRLLGERAASAREAALLALPSVAARGDAGLVAAALAQAEDKSERIRRAAVRALGALACEGDLKALQCMIRRLQDDSLCVRNVAMLSLEKTSGGMFTPSDYFLQQPQARQGFVQSTNPSRWFQPGHRP